jgi:ABC-type transport system involved in cytochrome c biogenesis permease subunit
MDSSLILGITTFIYMAATFCYVAYGVFRKDLMAKAGLATLVVAILANSSGIGLRWLETHQQGIGYVPLSNMYESLVFFALCIAVLYLFIELQYKVKIFGTYIVPFSFLAMAYASYSPEFGKGIKPLLPALQSNWLVAHVVTCFIGYAAFTLSCGLAIFYLFKTYRSNKVVVDSEAIGLLKTIDNINS